MRANSIERRREIRIGVLTAGGAALLGGLYGLFADPLIGVLLVLGGMALAISSSYELLQEPGPDEARSPASDDL